MSLLAVIVILIIWAIYAAVRAATPANPPIDNMEKHLKKVQSLPNQKARQKYLKSLRKK